MSDAGVFAVDRGLFEHPFFADEPFTQREAWQWLIKEAAWKPRRARAGNAPIELKRGELAHSVRFMAAAWQWTAPKVQRFLVRLKTNTMIDTRTDTGVTVITICNYDKYQFRPDATDTPTDTSIDTRPIQHRYGQEEGEELNNSDSSLRSESDSRLNGHELVSEEQSLPLTSSEQASARERILPRQSSRGARIPDDWQPSAKDRDYAIEKGIPPDRIDWLAEEFRNHWQAESGKQAAKKDWSAAWKKRVMQVCEYRGYGNGARQGTLGFNGTNGHANGRPANGFAADQSRAANALRGLARAVGAGAFDDLPRAGAGRQELHAASVGSPAGGDRAEDGLPPGIEIIPPGAY